MNKGDKKTYLKLGFVVIIGILSVFVFVKQISVNKTIEEVVNDKQELMKDDVEDINDTGLDELKSKYKEKENNSDKVMNEKGQEESVEPGSESPVKETQENKEISVENNDLGDEFKSRFSDKEFESVKSFSMDAAQLYFHDDFSFDKWEQYVDEKQFKTILKTKNKALLDDFKDKEIVRSNVHFVSMNDNELVVEVEVEWTDAVQGIGSSGNQINMFYIVYDIAKDPRLISVDLF